MGWSNEQIDAIQSHGTNELVNAGAGSGKTAVLSEHVLHLIKVHGYELKDFLIVTFTNDAANEMKHRIRSKLLADNCLSRFVNQIESAHIQTFDAFYLFLVNKYAHQLGLKEGIKIIDGSVFEVELMNTIENLFNQLYLEEDSEFIDLVTHLCVKNDQSIKKAIIKLYQVSMKKLDTDKYLNEYVDLYFSDEFINNLFILLLKEIKERINVLISMSDNLEVCEDAEVIQEYLTSLLSIDDYDTMIETLEVTSFPTNKYSRAYSDTKYRNKISDNFRNKIKSVVKEFGSRKQVIYDYKNTQKYTKIIVKLTQKVKESLKSYKQKLNMYEFIDISKYAIKLMEDPLISKEVKETFKYIMIDEYQDTNDIQERMIQLLEDNNTFMVGDIKQSIYRFNNSNCNIFENKYQRYKSEIGGHKIDMKNNYRSRPEFMRDLNAMFSILMDKKHNQISYIDDHISHPGNENYDTLKDDKLKYGINSLAYNIENFDMNKVELEASIIAEDILDKVNKGCLVFDKESEQLRRVRFNDFAIIADRGTNFDTFKTIFTEYKIPLFIQNDEKLLYSDVSMVIKNLLILTKCIINNEFDEHFKHSFISISRSFLKQYEDSFIYKIIKDGTYKNDDIILHIKEILSDGGYENLRSLLLKLFEVFKIEEKVISLGDVNSNCYYQDYFLSIADNLDGMHKNLDDFISYFNDLMNFELKIESAPTKDVDNSVLLINIHKSKGREFPICYFPLLNKKFNTMQYSDSIYVDKDFGMALSPLYIEERKSIISYLSKVIDNQQDIEEKMRLLYVALTRARECAILVHPTIEEQSIYRLADCKSMLDILSLARLNESSINAIDYLNYQTYNGGEVVENLEFILKEPIALEHELILENRASKPIDDTAVMESIKFGKKLHYLLELVDFSTKNTDFITNVEHRKIIDKVINNHLFEVDKNDKILHEYSYHDDINNINGVIDCLVIKKDCINIIDFKLKNIDDNAYDKQLRTYKKYIEQINDGKTIKMYLLSIIDNLVREVKDE